MILNVKREEREVTGDVDGEALDSFLPELFLFCATCVERRNVTPGSGELKEAS